MLLSEYLKLVAVELRVGIIRLFVVVFVGIVSKVARQFVFVVVSVPAIFSWVHFNVLIAILRHFSRPSKRPIVQCHGITRRISAADPNKRRRKRCRGRSNGCGGGQRFVGCILRLRTHANIDILAGLICESTISLVGYSCRSYMDK